MFVSIRYVVNDGHKGAPRFHFFVFDTDDYWGCTALELESYIREDIKQDYISKIQFEFQVPAGVKTEIKDHYQLG